jgi:APA family basic amino acid/polyamine antiporter
MRGVKRETNTCHTAHLERQLSLFSVFILVVANMIGTGIFTTSGFIMKELGNPATMLLCWLLGGVFALCGALCYGELGAMFPHSGGEYVFLREGFGKGIAFLSGWISLIVGFSAPIAASSVAFASYFFKAFPIPIEKKMIIPVMGNSALTLSPITLLAVAIIVLFSLVHYYGLFFGSRVQNGLTVFKITFIAIFIITGFWFGKGAGEHFLTQFDIGTIGTIGTIFSDKFAVSLIFISFAYSGWNAAVYLGGEIKNPSRNIPLSLFGGTFLVICLYLLLNAVFIYALPPARMSGVLEVGDVAASALFGNSVSQYLAGAIAIGILSAVSAMIVTGPRVYYAMAKDGVFFKQFGMVNSIHKTPAHSLFLQASIAAIMVLTSAFDTLLIYIGFTLSLFAMTTVVGLMVLRIKHPSIKREYKTFGYPITPILFILGNLWIIYYSLRSRLTVSLYGLGTIGLGYLVYLYFRKQGKKALPLEGEKVLPLEGEKVLPLEEEKSLPLEDVVGVE